MMCDIARIVAIHTSVLLLGLMPLPTKVQPSAYTPVAADVASPDE
jgi:hypothetical protein